MVAAELWRIEAVSSASSAPFNVGVVRLSDRRPGLRFEAVRDELFVVAVGREHRLAGADALPLHALADEAFITFGRAVARAWQRTVLRVCRGPGSSRRLDERALLPPVVRKVFAARGSIMLIPQAAAPPAAAAGAVTLTLGRPSRRPRLRSSGPGTARRRQRSGSSSLRGGSPWPEQNRFRPAGPAGRCRP